MTGGPVLFEYNAANIILLTLAGGHKPSAWPNVLALALLGLFTRKEWPAGLARPRNRDSLSRVALPNANATVPLAAYTIVGEILSYEIQASGKAKQGSKVHIFCRDLASLQGHANLAVQAGAFEIVATAQGGNHQVKLPATLNLQEAVDILACNGFIPLPQCSTVAKPSHQAAVKSGSACVATATDRYKRLTQAGLGVDCLDNPSVPTNAVRTVSIFRTKARELGFLLGGADAAYDDLKGLWKNSAAGRPGGFKTFDEFWNTPWVGAMLGRGEPKSLDDARFGDTLKEIAGPESAEADLKDAKRELLLDTGRLSLAQLLILRTFEQKRGITREQAGKILAISFVQKEFPAAFKASRTQPAEAVLNALYDAIKKSEEQILLGARSIHETIFEKLTSTGVLTEAHRILLTALDWYGKDRATGALKAAAASYVVQNAIKRLRDAHSIESDTQAVGHLIMEALKRYEDATGKRLAKPQTFSPSLDAAKFLSGYHFAQFAQERAILASVPTTIEGLDSEIELRLATRGLERAAQWGFEGLRKFLGDTEFDYEQAVAQRRFTDETSEDTPVRPKHGRLPPIITPEQQEHIGWAFQTVERYPQKDGEDLRAWLHRLSRLGEEVAK